MRVLTDQLRVFDVQAIAEILGHVDRGELEALDDALAVILGLRG
jgi:mRNA-degrading endonuclease toxin of MazEF toxin-antitoxin module